MPTSELLVSSSKPNKKPAVAGFFYFYRALNGVWRRFQRVEANRRRQPVRIYPYPYLILASL